MKATLVFIFLASFGASFTYADDFIPNGVITIPRDSLDLARQIYRQANDCGAAVAQLPPLSKRLRARLLKEANIVGQATFGPQTLHLIRNAGPRGNDRPLPEVFADALEEEGSGNFAPLVRAGLFKENVSEEPTFGSDTARFDFYRRFFYLFRLNQIPDFVSTPRQTENFGEFYFYNDILWGIRLTATQLLDHGAELAEHPSLEHLTIDVESAQIADLARLPVMRKLTSLKLLFRDALPNFSDDELEALRATGQFGNLRRLCLSKYAGIDILTSSVFRIFRIAPHVEELVLDSLTFDRITSIDLFAPVKSLTVTSPKFAELSVERNRRHFGNFFAAVNPNLQSLRWRASLGDSFSRTHFGEILQNAPEFTSLTDLELDIPGLSPQQVSWLVHKGSLWHNLRNFSFKFGISDQKSRARELIAAMNEILVQTNRLKTLHLSHSFRNGDIAAIFNRFEAPLTELRLNGSEFTDDGVVRLAALPSVRTLEELIIPLSRISDDGVNALAFRLPKLKKLVVGSAYSDPARRQTGESLLSQRGIEVEWRE